MGVQWSFYNGAASDRDRYRYENGALVLKAKGTGPADSSPLWFVNGDQSYEIEVEIDAGSRRNRRPAAVLQPPPLRRPRVLGEEPLHAQLRPRSAGAKPPHVGGRLHIRLRNDRHIVTMHYSVDGTTWERFDRGIEVSGYHHNVAYDFLSLRPALYAAGTGEVRFRNFRYRALP